MSTALLKFKSPHPAQTKMALDSSLLAGAVEACPEPVAVIENGKVIYGNRSFAQLSAQFDAPDTGLDARVGASDSRWRTTNFAVGDRALSVTTLGREAAGPEAAHLEMLGRLVGGVAHDFNNLLTGILLHCDLVKTKLPAANPLALKIEEIRRAADQGAGLIRQLMTVGRDEKGAPRWVSLNHAIKEMLPLLRHLAGEHIAITAELAAGAPRVGISLAEAQQLMLNLVLNARDAMPAGGTVILGTRLGKIEGAAAISVLEFAVTDSGSGMDAKTAARVFEPFYTTKVLGGTGTGLATVKRIVDDARGTVCVDTVPGRGTRMTIRLPQIELPEHEAEALPSQPHPPRHRPKRSGIQQPQSRNSENRGAGV
jgi:signal transduction histidine kinase